MDVSFVEYRANYSTHPPTPFNAHVHLYYSKNQAMVADRPLCTSDPSPWVSASYFSFQLHVLYMLCMQCFGLNSNPLVSVGLASFPFPDPHPPSRHSQSVCLASAAAVQNSFLNSFSTNVLHVRSVLCTQHIS